MGVGGRHLLLLNQYSTAVHAIHLSAFRPSNYCAGLALTNEYQNKKSLTTQLLKLFIFDHSVVLLTRTSHGGGAYMLAHFSLLFPLSSLCSLSFFF